MAKDSHYETLGVSEQASAGELKRRFRELARIWHPDVARAADAAERFKAINEAYRVLSNPVTRAQYDAELRLAAARTARPQTSGGSTSAGAARASHTSRSASSSPPRPETPPRERRRPEPEYAYVVARLLVDARTAMHRMRLFEAIRCCRAVLNLDSRNADAHEILGDVCGMRNQVDAAIAHYTIAIQLDPRNARLRAKFEHAAADAAASGTRGRGDADSRAALAARQAAALMLGLSLIAVIVALVASSSGGGLAEPWVPWDWAPAVFLGLPAAGAVAGLVCAYAGLVRPARAELLMTTSASGGRSVVPMGVILVVLSLVCFWLAGLLYAGAASLQEALSRSVVTAFIVCACIVGMFAAVLTGVAAPVLILGGNLVFPAFVGGWALGDSLRQ